MKCKSCGCKDNLYLRYEALVCTNIGRIEFYNNDENRESVLLALKKESETTEQIGMGEIVCGDCSSVLRDLNWTMGDVKTEEEDRLEA